jgi:hypothetical protein
MKTSTTEQESPSLKRLDCLHQDIQAAIRDIACIRVFLCNRLTQGPGNITPPAQTDEATALTALQALLEPTGVLPLLGGILRAFNNLAWNPAHGRAVHTETAFCNTILKLVQECHTALDIVHMDGHALGCNLGMIFELGGKRVVMGGKEAQGSNMGSNVVKYRLGHGNTVIRASSTTKFVKDDK